MRSLLLAAAIAAGLASPADAQTLGDGDPEGETEQTDDGFEVIAGHVDDRQLTSSVGPRDGTVIRCEFWEVHGTATGEASPYPVAPSGCRSRP